MMARLLCKTGIMNSNMRVLMTPAKASTIARTIKISTESQSNTIKRLWSPLKHCKVSYLQSQSVNASQSVTYCTEPDVQKKSTALSVIKDLRHLGTSPAASLLTGLGGLIPFMSVPAYMLIAGYFSPFLAYSQIAYGASILSFLGGIRWGLTIPEESSIEPSWFNIGYSVTPSLIAWVGLLFPTPLALCTLMAGMGGALYMDLTMYGYPAWFRALRFLLTIFAMLSLWTTLVLRFTLKTYEEKLAEPPRPIKAPKKEVKPVKVKDEAKKSKPEPKVSVTETPDKVQVVEEEVKEIKDSAETFLKNTEEQVKELKA